MDDYEKKGKILKSVLNPNMYQRAVEYIENGSPSPISPRSEVYNTNLSNRPMSASNSSSDIVHRLLKECMKSSNQGFIESILSRCTSEDVGHLPIAERARPNDGSVDILNSLLDLIDNDMPNPPYPGAALNQPPRPPMPPPNNPYFMGGRYSNQHYYPPDQ